MRLPKAENARVDHEKLTRYLLSETHPVGRSKAKFFRGVGYDESSVTVLEQGLIEIARTEAIVETAASRHGMKYIVDGLITTPSGGRVRVRTVWIVDAGEDRPRFVTAYPL
ncbi:MAG: DUF6883 domain-containing protein [Fimbriimonadales bacterium]